MYDKKVAILLTTYNGQKYIREQMESFINQDFENWTCYIHDDGSADSTTVILKEYAQRYPDKFKIIDYEGTGGAKNNFFFLMSYFMENHCQEDYIMFSDQDDIWENYKISTSLKDIISMDTNEESPIAVFTDLKVVDNNNKLIANSFMQYSKHDPYKTSLRELFVANPAPGCTMMINRTLCMLAVRYKDISKIEMHDWWCMLIAAAFGKIKYIDLATIRYRQHGKNTLGAVDRISAKYKIQIFKSVISGERTNETKERIIAKRNMAEELYEAFADIHNGNSKFIKEMALIKKQNKAKRMFFYLNNHLYNTLAHGIWVLACC